MLRTMIVAPITVLTVLITKGIKCMVNRASGQATEQRTVYKHYKRAH
jgi:hypothetical protein